MAHSETYNMIMVSLIHQHYRQPRYTSMNNKVLPVVIKASCPQVHRQWLYQILSHLTRLRLRMRCHVRTNYAVLTLDCVDFQLKTLCVCLAAVGR